MLLDPLMRLTEILQPECVKVPLEGGDKRAVIRDLVEVLTAHTPIKDAGQLMEAVWQREQTRTTGIGHGIGIPHGKCAEVDRLRMAIGRPADPIEFGSIDGKPVDLVILLASPIDQTGPHIQALARISRILTDPSLRDQLKTGDAAAIYALIRDREAQAAG